MLKGFPPFILLKSIGEGFVYDAVKRRDLIKLLKKQAKDHKAQLIVITHDARLKKHFKNNLNL